MSRTCPSCGSDRCGNHAACARRKEADSDRVGSWIILWYVVGVAETLMQRFLAKRSKFDGAVVDIAFGEPLRRRFAEMALFEMERRTR